MDSFVTVTVTDPTFMKYPVTMVTEPGCWNPTEQEVQALRKYVQKGGFLFLDDLQFSDGTPVHQELSIARTEAWLKRVLPEGRLVPLTVDHPIFDSFYKIETLVSRDPIYGVQPEYYGIFEDNDPTKRLMVIVNYNQDLSEYWEFSDEAWFPIDLSNEAYKIGVNYMIYALSR